MSGYTPTTEEIVAKYTMPECCEDCQEEARAFDRWLAEVKAQAWEEGYSEDSGFLGNNPYRGENK